jgi:hypothetical protein
MIFSSNILDNLANETYKHLTTALVYKGTQPDSESYVSGVNNGTYDKTGIFLLHAYTGYTLTATKINEIVQITKQSNGTNYSVQSGFAEWAVLFHKNYVGSGKLINFTGSNFSFLRNITEDDCFLIVPVSTLTGTGVLKFANIEFIGVAKNMENFYLNLAMSG